MVAPHAFEVHHQPEHSRFVANIDGKDCIVRYQIDGDTMHVLSTTVPPVLEGRGIAAVLTRAALAYADEQGLQVNPVCTYTVAYLRRHPR